MAFFSTAEVPWLYSGATKTKASKESIFAAQALVWLAVFAHGGRHRLVEMGKGVFLQVDQLELCAAMLLGMFVDPVRDRLAVAARACASEDDCYLEHVGEPPERTMDRSTGAGNASTRNVTLR
jgi:hypothetical protein